MQFFTFAIAFVGFLLIVMPTPTVSRTNATTESFHFQLDQTDQNLQVQKIEMEVHNRTEANQNNDSMTNSTNSSAIVGQNVYDQQQAKTDADLSVVILSVLKWLLFVCIGLSSSSICCCVFAVGNPLSRQLPFPFLVINVISLTVLTLSLFSMALLVFHGFVGTLSLIICASLIALCAICSAAAGYVLIEFAKRIVIFPDD
ncbi:hypothetical protein niasHT_033895 [Heterodera trifolii]|uniref:Uncharacterized protein n=1 Tax=Heterodera trifolii TaxID=157864 RepID=A0ABD2HPG7_9BILA